MAEPLFSGRKVAGGHALPVGKPNCAKCGYKRKDGNPQAKVMGKGAKGILILMESPKIEGSANKLLRGMLTSLGIDLSRDCWRMGAVSCPIKKPTAIQVECCRPAVMSTIKERRPEKIIAMGGSALESLLGHRWTHEQLGKLARWRGHRTPDRDLRAWLYVTFNPAHAAKAKADRDPIPLNTLKRDLKEAIKHEPPPVDWDYDPERDVQIINDATEIRKAIRLYRGSGELVSFDYEGTGLKYHAKGHALYTASLATPGLGAISFPLYPDVLSAWKRFLVSDVPKTAHNIKFEEAAGYEVFGVRTAGWKLCTMQGAHVLDNRKGTVSLEFQVYTRLGFLPWGMDIKAYFSATHLKVSIDNTKKKKGANAINRIREAPIRSVLLYGGLDSLSQSMLAHLPEYKELWVD